MSPIQDPRTLDGRALINGALKDLHAAQATLIEKRDMLSRENANGEHYPGMDDWAIARLSSAITALVTKPHAERK
jgi:hypothetical protein